MRNPAANFVAALLLICAPAGAEPAITAEVTTFEALQGWMQDDHASALEAFTVTCGDLRPSDWKALCDVAKSGPDARWFFETFFRPVLVHDDDVSLITGYFEPEITGARQRTGRFNIPVYRKPPELTEGMLWHSREEIETGDVVSGRGLELAWVEDPTALFYMQVQGSGRIRFTDGSVLRLGYAASNGHKYRSPGEMLVSNGIYAPHQVSAQVVSNWVRRNPDAGARLLRASPSYVFFREIRGARNGDGPRGAMNRPLTSGRSIAVDPAHIMLGAPVWMEKGGEQVLRKLMIAQDTGSAIKGAQRADYFVGTGSEAGRIAQQMNDAGRLFVLMPIDQAYALVEGAK